MVRLLAEVQEEGNGKTPSRDRFGCDRCVVASLRSVLEEGVNRAIRFPAGAAAGKAFQLKAPGGEGPRSGRADGHQDAASPAGSGSAI